MSVKRKTFPGELYYVTLTVVGWIDVFTRKEYVYEIFKNVEFCQEKKGLELYAYVIMSNHMHLIAKSKDGLLSDILRDFKSYTAKSIISMIQNSSVESRRDWMMYLFKFHGQRNSQNKIHQFWQQNNYPVELYSNEVIDQKINYLHNNPVKSGIVEKPEDYIFSSAYHSPHLKVLEL